MEIFDLKFIENEECDYIKFYLKKNDLTIKVYIYRDCEVFLNEADFFDKSKPTELFQLAFDEQFIEFVNNGNEELFKFNKPEFKQVYRELKELIKNIKN